LGCHVMLLRLTRDKVFRRRRRHVCPLPGVSLAGCCIDTSVDCI
jgi:hypothetical protein